MNESEIEALGRVYAAAYSASGKHQGMVAGTDPEEARANAREACFAFVGVMRDISSQMGRV